MTSPGARYSAGTAFLDVIPSFRGVQKAIAAEAKKMEQALGKEAGETLGKAIQEGATTAVDKALGTTKAQVSGRQAGEKYAGAFTSEIKKAMAAVDREIQATLKFGTDDSQVRRTLTTLQAEVKALSNAKIGVDMDAGMALAKIAAIQEGLKTAKILARDIDLKVNTGAMQVSLDRAKKQIESLNNIKIAPELDERKLGLFEATIKRRIEGALKNIPPVEFDADVTPAQAKVQELRQELLELGGKRIGIDVDGSAALIEMERIRARLEEVSQDSSVNVQVRTDAAGAMAELSAVRALAELVDGRKVEIKADVDTGQAVTSLERLHAALMRAAGGGENAANGFRAFNFRVLGAVTLLPSLIPLLGATAGAMALFGPLALGAAAGVGVLGFAFLGIQDAVSAMGKAQDNAAQESEASAKRIQSANRGVEDAQRALARAEEQGARSIADAQRSVSDARADAAQVAEDSAERVADAIEAQEDAEQDLVRAQADVVRAQEAVNRAREQAQDRIEDLRLSIIGGALAEREAVLDLAEAQREYEAALRDPKVSVEDRERLLIDLQQQELQLERLRLENGRLGEQQAEVNRTGVEGSREVLSAQEQLRAAEERRADAQERVGDAVRAVGEAIRDGQRAQAEAQIAIQDAIANERQAREDAAASIANAQLNLQQAQQDYTAAINESSASARTLETAMNNLSPAGQRFATFIFETLLPAMRSLRDIAAEGVFPGLEAAITRILTVNGPMLATFMTNMSGVLGQLFRDFGDMMTSPQWMGIWATFSQYAPIFMDQFGRVAMAMLTFFGELFQGLAPYAERFGQILVGLAISSAEWMATFTESQQFRDIMGWLFTNGPVIFGHFWDIARAIGAILIALAPLGEAILGVLGHVADFILAMDPNVLGFIVTTILGLVVAFQLAAGAAAIVALAATAVVTPLVAVVGIATAVIAVLVGLYTQSETFRAVMDSVFNAVGAVISWWWNNVTLPVFNAFAATLAWLWENVTQPYLGFMGGAWAALVEGIRWAWDNILLPTWNFLAATATWLWENVLRPIFTFIGDAWNFLLTAMLWAWDNILHPMWNVLMGVAQVLLAFLTVVIFGPLILAWEGLSRAFLWAYENIIQPMWNAMQIAGRFLWENVLRPIFQAIEAGWNILANGMNYVYHRIIYPYIIVPFRDGMEWLGREFERIVAWISDVWDNLQNALSRPINFVIKYVLNDGLFAAFNHIVSTLGLNADWRIAPWGQVGDRSTHFATGGRVPGWSPNPTADNIPAMLTAGEYVHPVDSVNYYGSDVMEAIRKKKLPREVIGEALRHYATGGFVLPKSGSSAPVVYRQPQNIYGAGDRLIIPQYAASGSQIAMALAKFFPRLKINSTYRPGDPGFHGRDQAVDVGEQGFSGGSGRQYIADMKRWAVDNWGRANEIIYNGIGNDRPNIKNGQAFPYSPATQAQHRNHLHIAIAGSILSAIGGPGGGPAASGSAAVTPSLLGGIWNSVTGVFEHIKGGLGKLGEFASEFGNNKLTQIIKGAVEIFPGRMWDKIKDSVQGLWDSMMSAVGLGDLPPAGQSGPVVDIVRGVAKKRGWDSGAEWNALSTLIQKESSWNPNAQNPTSTAYGLFQFLNSTWAGTGIAKTSDPALQTEAGLRYIASRYGTPSSALRFHLANNWYSEGGEVTENGPAHLHGSKPADAPTLYDTGGWLPPGVTTVLNATNRPEPVLTGQAWEELVNSRATDSDGGRRVPEHLHIHEVQTDMAEAIETVNHWTRVYARGGRY